MLKKESLKTAPLANRIEAAKNLSDLDGLYAEVNLLPEKARRVCLNKIDKYRRWILENLTKEFISSLNEAKSLEDLKNPEFSTKSIKSGAIEEHVRMPEEVRSVVAAYEEAFNKRKEELGNRKAK